MKLLSFREFFLKEELTLPIATGTLDITDEATAANINMLLARALNQKFLSPYIALEKMRQVLAHFSVHLEGTTKILDSEEGSYSFAVMQFGGVIDNPAVGVDPEIQVDRFIYFAWELNEEGTYDVFGELVNQEELEILIADEDDEDEDDAEEEIEESTTDSLDTDDKKLDKEHDAGKILSIAKNAKNPAKAYAIAAINKWSAQNKTLDKKAAVDESEKEDSDK